MLFCYVVQEMTEYKKRCKGVMPMGAIMPGMGGQPGQQHMDDDDDDDDIDDEEN